MKKYNFFVVTVVALLLISSPSEAANWKLIADTENGDTGYIDTESISNGSDESKQLWIRFDKNPSVCSSSSSLPKKVCVTKNFMYERVYSDKTWCCLQFMVFYSDGTSGSKTITCEKINFHPNSFQDKLWNYLYPSSIEVVKSQSNPIEIEKWEWIDEQPNGDNTYIDTESITGGNESKGARIMMEFKVPVCVKPFPLCVTKLVVNNRYFRNKSYCEIQSTGYFTDGTNRQGERRECVPKTINTNSIGEVIWKYIFRQSSATEF